MEEKTPALQRPRAVEISAAVLILTPFLDVLMMQRTGVAIFNWVGWITVFGAGVSLMIRHKLSWIVGIALCGLFVGSTLFVLIRGFYEVEPVISTVRLLNCALVLFIVSTVLSFFRYPYLDRRQNWLAPTGERVAVATPILLSGGVEAQTVDMSYVGARLRLPGGPNGLEKDSQIEIQLPDINDITCKARVVEIDQGLLRVHFVDMTSSDKEFLRQWLRSQNLQKI